jgi:hypothetical protein
LTFKENSEAQDILGIETEKKRAPARPAAAPKKPKKPDPKKPKAKGKKKVVKEKAQVPSAEPKGTRQVPTPTDKYGCTHYGIMDLKAWSKEDLKYYTKKDFWLDNKPCSDCVDKAPSDRNRVMDVGSILVSNALEKGAMVMVCNCGPTAHRMQEDDPSKPLYSCDMVLCVPCYKERKEAFEETLDDETTIRKSKRRKT